MADAKPGDLDSSFGRNGKVITGFGDSHARAHAVAIDPKGRIVAAGNVGHDAFALTRYRADGHLDRSFSGNGRVLTSFGSKATEDEANAVAIDGRGRIVAVGITARIFRRQGFSDFEFAIARYKPNGSLDRSFSRNGKKTTNFVAGPTSSSDMADAVAIDSRDRIVAAGGSVSDFALARYRRDGRLDRSFGTRGRVTTDFVPGSATGYDEAHAVSVDSRGRIVAAGTGGDGVNFVLARYKPNGSLDPSFGAQGKVETDFPGENFTEGNSAAIDSAGRIVVAGTYNNDFFALARYEPNGSLDGSFGDGGELLTRFGGHRRAVARSVAIDSRDRIVAVGNIKAIGNFALARYRASGRLDRSFGPNGRVTTDFAGRFIGSAESVAIDSRDRIVAAGFTGHAPHHGGFALTRYLGSSDSKADVTP